MTLWYCKIGDREIGPVGSNGLRKLVAAEQLRPNDLVKKGEDGRWARAAAVKGLFPSIGAPSEGSSCDDGEEKPGDASDKLLEAPASRESADGSTAPDEAKRNLSTRDMVGIGAIAISIAAVLATIPFLMGGNDSDDAISIAQGSREPQPDPPSPPPANNSEHPSSSESTDDASTTELSSPGTVSSGNSMEGAQAGAIGAGGSPPASQQPQVDPPPGTVAPASYTTPSDATLGESTPAAEHVDDAAASSKPLTVPTTTNNIMEDRFPGVSESRPPTAGLGAVSGEPAAAPGAYVAKPEEKRSVAKSPPGLFDAKPADAFEPLTNDPPDSSVQERKDQLDNLFRERQSLVTALRDVGAKVEQAEQKLAQTQQQLKVTDITLAGQQMQFLALAQQRQTANVRTRLNLMRVQNAQTLELKGGLEQQERQQNGQLGATQQQFKKKQDSCKEFCLKWADVYDPFGGLSDAHQQLTIELCTGWLTEGEEFPEAYVLRGFARLYLNQHQAAIADFDRIIGLAQRNQLPPCQQSELVRALVGRAMARTEMDQDAQATSDLADAAKLDSKSVLVRIGSGRTHARFERFRSACEDFLRATKLDKTEPAGYREAAWLMATSPVGNETQAIELGKRACELSDWKDWRCLDTYAVAAAAAGDFTTATKWVTEAVQLAPAEVKPELTRHIKLCEAGQAPKNLLRK